MQQRRRGVARARRATVVQTAPSPILSKPSFL
jgi:hypothetical protein